MKPDSAALSPMACSSSDQGRPRCRGGRAEEDFFRREQYPSSISTSTFTKTTQSKEARQHEKSMTTNSNISHDVTRCIATRFNEILLGATNFGGRPPTFFKFASLYPERDKKDQSCQNQHTLQNAKSLGPTLFFERQAWVSVYPPAGNISSKVTLWICCPRPSDWHPGEMSD